MENNNRDNEEMPLVSVVVPVYKVEMYVEKCIQSLIEQTYKNLEIILVDDGSPDKSGNICDDYATLDSRIKVYHKNNGGLSEARNYGIKQSHGSYITFIDSDDFVDLDYVEYLLQLIQKYDCRVSLCTHRVKYDSGKIIEMGNKLNEVLDAESCLERMLYHDVIDTSAWGKLYDRRIFEDIEYPVGRIFEDIGTTYKTFLKCKKIACGYSPKYTYVFHENSIVNSAFSPEKLDMLDMTEQMAKDVLLKYPTLESAVNRRRIYARFSTLNQMLNCDDYKIERNRIISYIIKNKNWILLNKKAPKRDYVAVLLLMINFKLYRFVWNKVGRNK